MPLAYNGNNMHVGLNKMKEKRDLREIGADLGIVRQIKFTFMGSNVQKKKTY